MNESCQSLKQVGLLHNRWRHKLSPPPQFRHGTGGEKNSFQPLHPWFLLRPPTRHSDPLIERARTLCLLGGYLIASDNEPRPSEALSIGDILSAIGDGISYVVGSFLNPIRQFFFPPRNSNSSIQYLLYTPEHPTEACYLETNQKALERCPFDSTHPLKILVHGFLSTLQPGNQFEMIKDNMLAKFMYNVIIVNWTKYNQPPYTLAATVIDEWSRLRNLGPRCFCRASNSNPDTTVMIVWRGSGCKLRYRPRYLIAVQNYEV
ncbi:lipase domain-containing protein [Trichonephila clavipes]|nr:lipase domain-containing protein [Trichonephila clavipes]